MQGQFRLNSVVRLTWFGTDRDGYVQGFEISHRDMGTRSSALTKSLIDRFELLEDGGSAVLMSHLGRPKGERKAEMSLSHIREKVSEVLGVEVKFCPECVGDEAEKAVALNPNSADAHMRLGKTLSFAGRWEESIPEYKKALRLNPVPPNIYLYSLGLSYAMTG